MVDFPASYVSYRKGRSEHPDLPFISDVSSLICFWISIDIADLVMPKFRALVKKETTRDGFWNTSKGKTSDLAKGCVVFSDIANDIYGYLTTSIDFYK